MIFRPLFGTAPPIWQRDLAAVKALELRLAWTLDTHVYADHITLGAAPQAGAKSKPRYGRSALRRPRYRGRPAV